MTRPPTVQMAAESHGPSGCRNVTPAPAPNGDPSGGLTPRPRNPLPAPRPRVVTRPLQGEIKTGLGAAVTIRNLAPDLDDADVHRLCAAYGPSPDPPSRDSVGTR